MALETTYFKIIGQKTAGKLVLISVVEENMIGNNLPTIFEAQAILMPPTIYTGTYPTIKFNSDTIKSREDLIGMGVGGIVTEAEWYIKRQSQSDPLGISILNR